MKPATRFMNFPQPSFFICGMGNRRKLLFREGVLSDARSGEIVRRWDAKNIEIAPHEYSCRWQTPENDWVALREDETGVWLHENAGQTLLSEGYVSLPRFEGHPHQRLLRALHAEILVNIVGGEPVPNFLVYDKAWYRDAASMAMCLDKTGNLHLIENWIRNLRGPFDLNNKGNREPDNLGQLLYLISLVGDDSHPLVATILEAAETFRRDDFIIGLSDYGEHPVYQTKWLKFGLRALKLPDCYQIPAVFDSYSALFWMDFRQSHVDGAGFSAAEGEDYPYLAWAQAHFHGAPPPFHLLGENYPLTWEGAASEANYEGMKIVYPAYLERRLCAPHTWHAAEAFLYLGELNA